jgi:peptidoglycan hydrolase FlgJ
VSISPVSDIVLDVVRAADPAKSRAAAEKLSHLDGVIEATNATFEHVLASTKLPASVSWPSRTGAGVKSAGLVPSMDAQTKAYKGLEQLVLKNLVENMLPNESAGFFGSGTAADIWRSMLADHLATEMGHSVDLGISNRQITMPSHTSGHPAPSHHAAANTTTADHSAA